MTSISPTIPRDAACAELLGEIQRVCGVLNVAHARLVALTAQAIDEDLWQGWGIRSVEHFLCWQAGLSPTRAKQIVEIANRFEELPETVSQFVAGELSVDQMVAVAERVPAHNDEDVAQFAKSATVTQLRSALCKQMFAVPDVGPDDADDADDADDGSTEGAAADVRAAEDAKAREQDRALERRADLIERAQAPAELSMGTDGTRFWLHLDAPVDDGALVEHAITEARDRLFATHPEVSWGDALTDVCARSLTGASTARRDHYRVLVHLDTEGSWINQGPALPSGLMRRVSCDGVARPVWETEGRPVNVGRSQRIVPDHTRALVEDRDRECVFPGCHAGRFLEVHHLIHWLDGGPTDTWNLACLCPGHHARHHRGHFTVTGNADQSGALRFVDRDGRLISAVGRPVVPTGPLPQPASGHEYVHPRGEPMQRKWLYFSPPPAPRRPAA